MIRATKAVREEVSHKVDIERFEFLLQPINFQHYYAEAAELFVIFELIEEEPQTAKFFLEDSVGYLTVPVPYLLVLETEDPFGILSQQFLSSLDCIEGLEEASSFWEKCQTQLCSSEVGG